VAEQLSFCMVTTFYPPHHFGGDALFVHRLCNALARRGHAVTVVYNEDAHRVLARTAGPVEFQHEPGVEVVPLRSRAGGLAPLATYLTGRPLFASRELRSIFRPGRFDVINFHNVSLVGGPGILAYGDGLKLYTMHEHWLVCPMHVLWRYNRELCDERRCVRCALAFRRPPQPWRHGDLLSRACEHVDLFLAPSRFVAAAHRERGFKAPVRHLPLFVPGTIQPVARPSTVEPTRRPYVLYVGRLERIKGVETLIEFFESYGHADLLIAGRGTQEAALRRKAEGNHRVRFLGNVEPPRLWELYAGALALAVPSVGYEVFPLVTLEAFAQRTPVVARRLGGLPEVIEESGGGYTYSEDGELEAALEALRLDPLLRRRLGEQGHEALGRVWSEEAYLDRYLGIIDELGTRPRPRLEARV
jgi:glycosyltransferase involved in cell wall biosynthesis